MPVLDLFSNSRTPILEQVINCSYSCMVLEPILHSFRTVHSRTVLENLWNRGRWWDFSPLFQCQSYLLVFLNSNKFKIPKPYPHLVICQNIVLEKASFMSTEPITTYSKDKNYISFILKWVGYTCFNKREGVDEPRSFNGLNTLHFSILHVNLLSNTNCTYKNCETAKLRDCFVLSDLSSAKTTLKESSQHATVVMWHPACILEMFVICSKKRFFKNSLRTFCSD